MSVLYGEYLNTARKNGTSMGILPDKAHRFRRDLLQWGQGNTRDYPWREPDRSLYEVFIAEFFLTQTPADNVADVYPRFLSDFPDLNALDKSGQGEIEGAIESLGFQRMRSEALNEIARQHQKLPTDSSSLQELPRVGPYVANATVCFALDEAVPILDRNVVRVYNRLFEGEFPEQRSSREQFAGEILPDDGEEARRYNLAILDFGATVCTKRDPDCENCFANNYCTYYNSVGEEAP